MAETKQVTEPAKPSAAAPVTEPGTDPYESVRVRDKKTGEILSRPVPRTWLDGRFPNLAEVPSNKKAGK